ncbi:MAG: DbpA RNA binding domain-containing protein, partial [bacterium]
AGLILAHPRELPHLRRLAREAGYELKEAGPRGGRIDEVGQFQERVRQALEEEDIAAYTTLLEPLLERWSGAEVAAALAALLRRRPVRERAPAAAPSRTPQADARGRPPAWSRLFLSVGSRDGVGPGDILGAITGEANLQGDQVGRIDIRDTFSRVEVEASAAGNVIQALNGITIRGRSVRADYDRGDQRGGGRKDKRKGPRP